jgi:hypothetical protein
MNCLARCAESAAPLCCLGEFLEKLSALGWDQDDVLKVERAVLVILGHIEEKSLEQAPPSREPSPAPLTSAIS